MIFDNEEYSWIAHSMMMSEMPLLGINTKISLIRRLNKLIALKVIKKQLIENRSWYSAGENWDYFFAQGVSSKIERGISKDTLGVSSKIHYNSKRSILKSTIEKVNQKEKFQKPSLEEIKNEIKNKKHDLVDADIFFNHYETIDWMVGKNKMKNWGSAISGWQSREKKKQITTQSNRKYMNNELSEDDIDRILNK